MLLNKDRLEEIKDVIFRGNEDDSIDFVLTGTKGQYPSYYLSPTKVLNFIESADDFTEMTEEDFLKKVADKELSLEIFRGYFDGKEQYDRYDTDAEVDAELGIAKMTVISTKVPEVIAKRFRTFAGEHEQSVASQLRRLTYDFVEKEFKEKAEDLMFRADI